MKFLTLGCLFILLNIATTSINSQNNRQSLGDFKKELATQSEEFYYIDNMIFHPHSRQVIITTQRMTGGFEKVRGRTIHWDGFETVILNVKSYDDVVLTLMGAEIKLLPKVRLNSIKVLYSNVDNEELLLYRDDSILYMSTNSDSRQTERRSEKYDLSDKIALNTFIYKDTIENKLYKLSKIDGYNKGFREIYPGDLTLDYESLKRLSNNLYTDKNGLYDFSGYQIDQLETSGDRVVTPIVTKHYIIYNKHVYSRAIDKVSKLDLNPDNIRTFDWGGIHYDIALLTDGKQSYTMQTGGTTTSVDFGDTSQWEDVMSLHFRGYYTKKDLTTLYTNNRAKKKDISVAGVLVKTTNGYLLVNGNGIMAYQNVYYYVRDEKKNIVVPYEERIDYPKTNKALCRHIAADLSSIDNCFDCENLQPILHDEFPTNFYSNGNILFYQKGQYFSVVTTCDNKKEIVAQTRSSKVDSIDFETLKVVGKNILTDKNFLYIGTKNMIRTIPIDKIGIEIKIIEAK